MKYFVIIPSLNPTVKLVDLLRELNKNNINDIIVINDGSLKEYDFIYNEISKMNIKVLTHDKNKGKGAGIKTAIKYLKNVDDVAGYITVDSDGQHKVSDILKIKDEMIKNKDALVLGVRDFNLPFVPFKSKYGNKISSMYFYMQTGTKCNDTQTGLRGIPKSLEEVALKTKGERYEYEMNFLTTVALNKLKIVQVPIETVYEGKNENSHFRPFMDSFLIYKEWFKFLLASLSSAVLDICIFCFLINRIGDMHIFNLAIICTIIARLISGIYNFYVNKYFSFSNNDKRSRSQFIKYVLLFLVQMSISAIITGLFSLRFSNVVAIKIIIDLILFFASFFIQKKLIFYNKFT